jgi:hypothetical protein
MPPDTLPKQPAEFRQPAVFVRRITAQYELPDQDTHRNWINYGNESCSSSNGNDSRPVNFRTLLQ